MTREEALNHLRHMMRRAENARLIAKREPGKLSGATVGESFDVEALKVCITMLEGPLFEGATVVKTKHTSPEMSTLASQMMTQTRAKLQVARERPKEPIIVAAAYLKRVLKLCGSVLSQDETPGQGDALKQAMTVDPAWAAEIPMSEEFQNTDRYKKD